VKNVNRQSHTTKHKNSSIFNNTLIYGKIAIFKSKKNRNNTRHKFPPCSCRLCLAPLRYSDFDALVVHDNALADPFHLSVRDRLEQAINIYDNHLIEAKYVRGKLVKFSQ